MENRNIILRSKMNLRILLVFSVMLLSFVVVNDTSASSYTLTLTSSGSQSIDMSASAGTAISSDAINVATTCRYGYNFTIGTSVEDNNLYLDGFDFNNTEGTYFEPVDGTSALNTSINKWGYYYNDNTIPTSTSIFQPVPSTLSDPATIKSPLVNPSSSDINDNFNIYYGVSVSPTMVEGTYKLIPFSETYDAGTGVGTIVDGTIVYTATIAEACTKYTVHFDPTSQFEGNTISGTGTMSDQNIFEGVATPLTNNGFTAPSGYYFAGWNTAQDGSGTQYTNGQQVTDLTTAGSSITLYAMWTDCPANRICYSPNVSNPSDVVGEMGNQTISSSATSATLYAPNYKRDNYGFVAWNTNKAGTGANYGPNQTLEFNAGAYSTGGLKLYAKWIASAGNMQDWTGCSSMDIGDVTARKDTRDNNVYAIAKLADDKCWMIENLRLADKDSNNNDINLSSTNTHNPSLPLNNSWYYDNTQTTLTTSNHLSASVDLTQTALCWAHSSDCIDQSILLTNNITFFTNNTSSRYDVSSDVYSYGNYYNWYSATAGHGKYGSSYGQGYEAPGDICPAGWHLPKGGNKLQESTNEFWQLIAIRLNNGVKPANYDSSTTPYYTGEEATLISNVIRSYPNNFIYSGQTNSATLVRRGTSGYYWSSSANHNNYTYNLSISNSVVRPGTNFSSKYVGWMVRCVACNYHFGISDCDDVGGGQL